MKAISFKNDYYALIEERGSFLYGKNNMGKIQCFPKSDANVVEIESLPKAKKYHTKKAAPVAVDPVTTWKNIALSVNDKINQHSTWQLASDRFGRINAQGNDFIESLLDSLFNKGRLSEKQAYYLAKFGVESGQLK